TPNIDRLSLGGVLFRDAATNASYTKASVASLLTSTFPWVHGVLTQLDILSDSLLTLPELLKESGYRTATIIQNSQASPVFGYGQGFDTVVEWYAPDFDALHKSSSDGNPGFWTDLCKPTLEGMKDQPFFAYIHLIDPHTPYTPPKEFAQMYAPNYQGRIGMGKDIMDMVQSGLMRFSPEDLAYFSSMYKAEVTSVDRFVGWLSDWLQENNLTHNTLVVFLSDHGEAFMEHGDIEHGRSLYQELVHVPLVFSLPGVLPEGTDSGYPAQLLDVAPTVLDFVGISAPEQMQGKSLLPMILGSHESDKGRARLGAVRNLIHFVRKGDMKLVRKLSTPESAQVKWYEYELFDLSVDPGEKINLWPSKPIEGRILQQLLTKSLSSEATVSGTKIEPEKLDPAVLQNLKDLGYLR
ncbi:MAG TPA: sulfatase, partial [bacterium]|nr:sulfatase [bacterium]